MSSRKTKKKTNTFYHKEHRFKKNTKGAPQKKTLARPNGRAVSGGRGPLRARNAEKAPGLGSGCPDGHVWWVPFRHMGFDEIRIQEFGYVIHLGCHYSELGVRDPVCQGYGRVPVHISPISAYSVGLRHDMGVFCEGGHFCWANFDHENPSFGGCFGFSESDLCVWGGFEGTQRRPSEAN